MSQIIGTLTHSRPGVGFDMRTSRRLHAADLFLYFVNQDEVDSLKTAIANPSPYARYPTALRYDIVPHPFKRTDGLVPFGAMREFAFRAMKRYGRPGDSFILADDDLDEAKRLYLDRYQSGDPRFSSSRLNGSSINDPMKISAERIERLGFPYFTFNRSSHSMKEPGPEIRFTGNLGSYYDSPCPFRAWDTQCEDMWASTRIVKEFDNRGLFQDTSISLCFLFGGAKYAPSGLDHVDHNAANHALVQETHRDLPIWKWSKNINTRINGQRGYRNIRPNLELVNSLRGGGYAEHRILRVDPRSAEPSASLHAM